MARLVTADTARVHNVPFLQDGVAEGDVARLTIDDDGVWWVVGCVDASGNCTTRVLPLPNGPMERSAERFTSSSRVSGLDGEPFSEAFPFVALTVPADADLAAVKALLQAGED